MSGKYDPLTRFLGKQSEDEVTLAFDRLERLLGFPLPDSARQHPWWWANQNPPRVQSSAWASAGWHASASLSSQYVIFRREHGLARTPHPQVPAESITTVLTDQLLENRAKEHLRRHLESLGWQTTVRSGKTHGIDIEAFREGNRWIIEVKGSHAKNPVNVTYFLSVVGELLQRMNDPNAKYRAAFSDIPQFRGLWDRLPRLAKQKTGITCLFVSSDGMVTEVE